MKSEEVTIKGLRESIASKKMTSTEVTQKLIDRISNTDKKINSFVRMNEKALNRARVIDEELSKSSSNRLLEGVPIAVKDMLCTEGVETTACSKILKGFIPPYSSTVVRKLEEAGAVILGKTNCDEFAMGSSNENSAYGTVKNPWNTDYVAGGSSGGSAACVSARMAPGSIGTDTGGSIRQPAGFCGVVGVKPTYGRVSRYGIVAFASSLDQAGPMTNTVEDSAILLEAISGHDPKDSTSSNESVPNWLSAINPNISGKTVGLPKEYFDESLELEVKKVVDEVIESIKNSGAQIKEISLPLTKYSISTYYLICTSEASSNLARYDGVRYGLRENNDDLESMYKSSRGKGFGLEVKRRIMLGTFALSSGYYDAYYQKACQVRRLIQENFLKAFEDVDVILGPVATTPAFKIGERINDPLKMYLNDVYTTSVNLAGLPGISVPAGFTAGGLPVGVQFIAPHFEEQRLFDFGKFVEDRFEAYKRLPNGI